MFEPKDERIAPLLRLIAEAIAARSGESHGQSGLALCELAQIARLQIPLRGVLPMSEDQLFDEIDNVATKHFDLGGVRATLDAALAKIESLRERDEIEVAIEHLCAVLNTAYFDAGLAFGITFADLKSL